jgi:hypothetical protein
MKMKNKIYYIMMILAALVVFTACDEEADHELQDIIKEKGGYFPVISSLSLEMPDEELNPGETVTLDLRYWSQGDMESIVLMESVDGAALSEVNRVDYQPAYSARTRTDSLLLNYQVPANLADTTMVKLKVQVVNANELTKADSVSFSVFP